MLMERVASEHDQIRKLTRLNRPLVALFVGSVRPVDSSHPDGFLYGNSLRRTPHLAVHVGAGDFGLQSHHWRKLTGRIVRSLCRPQSRVQESPQSELALQTLFSVVLHFFSV